MNHQDHVSLIKDGISSSGGVWADFGSGEGAFTLALRDILGSTAQIYSTDQDARSLQRQKAAFQQKFPNTYIRYIPADFQHPLPLPQLDGIVMANSLHYISNPLPLLQKIRQHYLKSDGRFILVEYNAQESNQWVPYPIPFSKFNNLAQESGFFTIKQLKTIPSRFLKEIYSAVALQDSQ